MKAHVGVDSRTELIHTVLASAANVADCLAVPHLLHGKETRVWAIPWARRRASGQGLHQPTVSLGPAIDESIKLTNRCKSHVRAKVEHPFGVIKQVFGFQKVCYRGLANNIPNA
jgi:IS5 family transposase